MAPILLQDAYTQSFGHVKKDFQLNMYDRGLTRPTQQIHSDCIVVFTYSNDMEVSKISFDMARNGIRLVRVDSDYSDSSCIDGISNDGELVVGNEFLTPRLLWKRHFFPQRSSESTYRQRIIDYSFAQMKYVESSVKRLSTKIINGDIKDDSLLTQLTLAKAVGFDIPNGVVTNDPQYAAKAVSSSSSKIVVKSLGAHWVRESSDKYIGTFPKVIDVDVLSSLPREPVPTLYQEYIFHDTEIRTYVVDDEIISFEVTNKKNAAQLWESPESVNIKPTVLPDDVQNKIVRFQQLMRFDYGAIDLLCDNNGMYTFLEVNLNGDWDYFEKQSHAGELVRKSMDNFLIKQFH